MLDFELSMPEYSCSIAPLNGDILFKRTGDVRRWVDKGDVMRGRWVDRGDVTRGRCEVSG